jgi:hypothetical protein
MRSMSLSGGITANFHGDMSGKIELVYMGKADYSNRVYLVDENGFQSSEPVQDHMMAELTFADIRKLYLSYIRSQKISRLEQMGDEELERLIEGC